MIKSVINTNNAPLPIGPYSQAVKVGGFLFLSGQIALDVNTGQLELSSIEKETLKVLDNIGAVLSAAGYSFDDVVKTSIFLSDMELFGKVNEVYSTFFTGNFPARETVAVKTLPKHVNVEISVTAYKD